MRVGGQHCLVFITRDEVAGREGGGGGEEVAEEAFVGGLPIVYVALLDNLFNFKALEN